jgi:small nuclear ribonucleoprotein (snRNP)-like protein
MHEENFDRFLKHLVGHTVLVRLKNGKILSGIFHQLNKEGKFFSIVLKMCREKDDIMTYPKEEEIIKSTDFLELKLDKLHLSINQGSFLTDTEISGGKNEKGGPRVLQPYLIDESIPMDEIVKPLDDDEELNWNQFDQRESTYTEDLYTTRVDRSSKAYLDNVEYYSEVEAKLLKEQTDNPHVAEERGQGFEDEFGDDERFSTVQRNQQSKKKNVNNNVCTKMINIKKSKMKMSSFQILKIII